MGLLVVLTKHRREARARAGRQLHKNQDVVELGQPAGFLISTKSREQLQEEWDFEESWRIFEEETDPQRGKSTTCMYACVYVLIYVHRYTRAHIMCACAWILR